MTYTSGEWKILQAEYGKDFAILAGGLCIAEVFNRVEEDIYIDAEANARLIAAAPAMLEALKGIYEDGLVIDALSLAGIEDVLNTAGSAIRKAEGGE